MPPPSRSGLPNWDRNRPVPGEPPAIGKVLDGMLGGKPWDSGLAIGRLARRWEEVVGERLAAESAPLRLDEHGTLLLAASSGAWGAQLRFLATEIAGAANRALRADRVREVRVTIDREKASPKRFG